MTPIIFKTKLTHKKGTEIEVYGESFTFDESGIGTLETSNPDVIDRLRNIPEGFEQVGGDLPTGVGSFIVKDADGNDIDLGEMSDADVSTIASQAGINVGKARGKPLRAKVVEAMNKD